MNSPASVLDPADDPAVDASAEPVQLIGDLLAAAVADFPDAGAVRDSIGAWTYRELADYADAFAFWLQRIGIRPGERIVVQQPSRRELVAMFYGAAIAGVVFVPLNPSMKPFHLSSVLANAEPSLVLGAAETLADLQTLVSAPVIDAAVCWADVHELAATGNRPSPVEIEPEDLAVLIYTSGSTAAPKAVMGPHAQVTYASWAINEILRYRPDDVVFCRFPMSWDYGLYKVLLSCLGRSEIVLVSEESDLALLRRMRETGATIVPIVPSLATMITSLAQRDTETPPPVRMFTNTGAALPPAVIAQLEKAFPGARVVRQFGQTECKRVSIMPPDAPDRPDSVGIPLPGTTVQILDPDGVEVGIGEIGEIVVSGPHVMPGYWRAPEVTARTFRPDPSTGRQRLHTGDYGSRDADGYLYFDGRRDDMFKRKGIRMSTLEIEGAAMDIPQVRGAAVVPPGEGRDLAIFVESDLEPHVVLKELARRLEPLKVPATCRVVPSIPLTAHGKNARKVLIELLAGGAA